MLLKGKVLKTILQNSLSRTNFLRYSWNSPFLFIILSLSLNSFFYVFLHFFSSFPYISPTSNSKVCCPCTARDLSIPLGSTFHTFMMNGDFWSSLHYLGQSISNKCDCARQVSLINMKVIVDSSRSFNSFLGQSHTFQNSSLKDR